MKSLLRQNWEKPFFILTLFAMTGGIIFFMAFFSDNEKNPVKNTPLPELHVYLAWERLNLIYPITDCNTDIFATTFHYDPPPKPEIKTEPPPPPPPPPPKKTVAVDFRGIYTNTQGQSVAMVHVLDKSTEEEETFSIGVGDEFFGIFKLADLSNDKIIVLGPEDSTREIAWAQIVDFTFTAQ